MTGAEQGFLLLTSHLGNLERSPLSVAQMHTLAQRAAKMGNFELDRDLSPSDLVSLGYNAEMAQRIWALLQETDLLSYYLQRGNRAGCEVVSRIGRDYPYELREALGLDSPGCLWYQGDISLLQTRKIAVVGSRDLAPQNRAFAETLGYQAARQGYTLVSGNARGADRTAQEACLRAGGKVISVVADELSKCNPRENVLYLSEDDFDAPFSAARALSRNRVIHALGEKTFVCQCTCGMGGTWNGTVKNLRFGWSPVFHFADGSEGSSQLEQMGAKPVIQEDLQDLQGLRSGEINFFNKSEY